MKPVEPALALARRRRFCLGRYGVRQQRHYIAGAGRSLLAIAVSPFGPMGWTRNQTLLP